MEWTTRAITTFTVSTMVLGLGLTGCGSESDHNTETTATSSAAATETTEAKEAPTTTAAPGKNPTIQTYIHDNGITETPVRRGDQQAPTVDLPVPEGWEPTGADNTPPGAYGAIVYAGPDSSGPPPTITAYYFKLTGNVDPQKLLDVANGELNNLEGWEPLSDGTTNQLSGFPAFQLGGTWIKDGQKRFIAQKTAVISGDDVVFVLQLNAEGLEDQIDIIGPATVVIDDETKITQ